MNESDIEKCFKEMDDTETKEALKRTTQEAVDYGVWLWGRITVAIPPHFNIYCELHKKFLN